MKPYINLCFRCIHFGNHRKRLGTGVCLVSGKTLSDKDGCEEFVYKRCGDYVSDLLQIYFIHEETGLKPVIDFEYYAQAKKEIRQFIAKCLKDSPNEPK